MSGHKYTVDEETLLPSELKWGHVKWFVPNLIDYARIVVVMIMPVCFTAAPELAAFLYFMNHFLDDFDGWAARRWCQCSKFGELLDMVIDVSSCVVFEAGIMALYGLWLMPAFMLSTLIDVGMLALVLTTRDDYWKVLVAQPSSSWILRASFHDGCHTMIGELLWKNQWCFHIYLYLAYFNPGVMWSNYVVAVMLTGFIIVKYQYILRIRFFVSSWSEPNRNTKGDQPPSTCKQGAAAE